MARRGELEDSRLHGAGVHLPQFQSICSQQRHPLAFLSSPTGHFSWFYHSWPNANFLIKCTTWFQMFVYLFQKKVVKSLHEEKPGAGGKVFSKRQETACPGRSGAWKFLLGRGVSGQNNPDQKHRPPVAFLPEAQDWGIKHPGHLLVFKRMKLIFKPKTRLRTNFCVCFVCLLYVCSRGHKLHWVNSTTLQFNRPDHSLRMRGQGESCNGGATTTRGTGRDHSLPHTLLASVQLSGSLSLYPKISSVIWSTVFATEGFSVPQPASNCRPWSLNAGSCQHYPHWCWALPSDFKSQHQKDFEQYEWKSIYCAFSLMPEP